LGFLQPRELQLKEDFSSEPVITGIRITAAPTATLIGAHHMEAIMDQLSEWDSEAGEAASMVAAIVSIKALRTLPKTLSHFSNQQELK
jgi:hypothetical protein